MQAQRCRCVEDLESNEPLIQLIGSPDQCTVKDERPRPLSRTLQTRNQGFRIDTGKCSVTGYGLDDENIGIREIRFRQKAVQRWRQLEQLPSLKVRTDMGDFEKT